MAKRQPSKKKSTRKATPRRSSKKTTSRKSGGGNGNGSGTLFDDMDDDGEDGLTTIPLRLAAQSRYLNYSLSVITSRALPDVRDGLKPVQRRILYTMGESRLFHTAKHRKCAKVVGDVMGNLHPHGDSSIYDALVRVAQPFSLRIPLVDGSGNFGSVDGDNAAAMRYTECRLTRISSEVLTDLSTRTVPFKANYDGTREEPVVLPSRIPNLLVNGATGIAVGMATNIPSHNLKEVCNALLKLLKDPEIKAYQLVANDAVHGPDFPTGGQVINSKEELREIYATGHGSLTIRGTSKVVSAGKGAKGKVLQIDSIPYGVNKANLVESINQMVFSGKLPLVVEARDLSTDDTRIDLPLKKDADPDKVLAFLYKNTKFQVNFGVNLTCLVPTENPEVGAPARLGLKEILWYFLQFRLDVITKRLENELAKLEKRLHILQGFLTVFDALDEIIRIIRRSDGKADAAKKIMKRFPVGKGKDGLDEDQTEAILELKLYRLAKLEINLIQDEFNEKQKRARQIRKLLKENTDDTNSSGRWKIVREEIQTILTEYCKDKTAKRRTVIEAAEAQVEYSEEDFIVAEDCHILITKDGWVKRQKQIADPSKSRVRGGDSVLAVVAGSTRATIGFFSSMGFCYTARMIDIPASTGFGDPIQKLFKLKDGEKIISALSFDTRVIGDIKEDPKDVYLPEVHGLAASSDGYALRFSLQPHSEASTKSGRRFARVKTGAELVGVYAITADETILAITANCRAMVCPSEEINFLSGPGRGVMLIKVGKGDKLLGFKPSTGDRDLLVVETNRGAQKTISTTKYRTTSRGGKGNEIQKNGKIAKIVEPPVEAPPELKPLKK
ncbi:DNA gyrase/topoisomerase IV subunit A [Mariniblastus fucicola]|uniref:DNA gyrase/topoisomerase IV subunit A n=1 Tax=Mariniblastus fucicola TaxID=980251 RepID=UPI0009462062|nr:DNA topoisomerase (ATP-hydrolyzing) [Mariniblastus fucicola]